MRWAVPDICSFSHTPQGPAEKNASTVPKISTSKTGNASRPVARVSTQRACRACPTECAEGMCPVRQPFWLLWRLPGNARRGRRAESGGPFPRSLGTRVSGPTSTVGVVSRQEPLYRGWDPSSECLPGPQLSWRLSVLCSLKGDLLSTYYVPSTV